MGKVRIFRPISFNNNPLYIDSTSGLYFQANLPRHRRVPCTRSPYPRLGNQSDRGSLYDLSKTDKPSVQCYLWMAFIQRSQYKREAFRGINNAYRTNLYYTLLNKSNSLAL